MHKRKIPALIGFLVLSLSLPAAAAAKNIPSPRDFLGSDIGDDYFLADFSQLESYWTTLARLSDRMRLETIGRSAEGRNIPMAVITSPSNHRRLSRYKSIARTLALADSVDENQARRLAHEGRAVIWIDGGLHGTEVLGAQQLIELVYRMTSRSDAETLRILDDVILLVVCSNPDGMELVSDWYMRDSDPEKRTMRGLPRLYHKYVGHDNNRDFYMSTQPETEAVNRILYREWFPQVVYNHHQTGPAGTVLFAPPFRDPFNYVYDPLVPLGIELVGTAMHSRFVREGKPGSTMRSGAGYSTWWNGGLRTTAYFHNMIGILTETIGSPTPMTIPFIPEKHLPTGDYPMPIPPQTWYFRQSIEYALTGNMAILDLASKLREDFLYNIYRMGKNSIERGSRDSWTMSPDRIDDVKERMSREKAPQTGSGRTRGYPAEYYEKMLSPESRDPRGYILPSDQPDFPTAVKFVNTLIKTGITIHRATDSFSVGETDYPAGSLVVKADQAFRPHVLTMFEPQNYPDDLPYPGAPPTPTYDNAGWTLAFQMGVSFDRILDAFDGPFERIEGFAAPPQGLVRDEKDPIGYLFDHRINDSFIVLNRLLKEGARIHWLLDEETIDGTTYPRGTFYLEADPRPLSGLRDLARELGLNFVGITSKPASASVLLKAVRIGLWDQYGGSMASGWMRWLLEQFEFPFDLVYPSELDAGELNRRFDVLIFPSGAIPDGGRSFRSPSDEDLQNIPEEYQDRLGRVTKDRTIPRILEFIQNGGTVLTLGRSCSLGAHAGLPIKDHLVEKGEDGKEAPLSRAKYFIPGSILRVKVDNSHPLAHGLGREADVMFNFSPVYRMKPEAALRPLRPIAWFDSPAPLRSGWAWGQQYLEEGIAVMEACLGRGKLFLFGPEIAFRGQPHGTFKLLFNGIFYGPVSANGQ
ncbi:MAG: peptidase [Acidobacteria bacterium]|nr:peptidase [Acidobacteriota bacterium]